MVRISHIASKQPIKYPKSLAIAGAEATNRIQVGHAKLMECSAIFMES
jgi:hypothetical protein